MEGTKGGEQTGCVHLVGAGPGDPELLTLKAQRLLTEADVVVYDRLVSQGVLDMIPAGATRIFVGKVSGHHHMPQDQINELLVKLAKKGHRVVRLKGGDPFVFGRGSEEAQELSRHGVPFTVTPGITAAGAIGAALGLPLTHRGMATGVRLVTGHCREDRDLDLNWGSLADPNTTLVVYMGLANVDQIRDKLIDAGLPASTPACAVANGTMPEQRQLVTTLANLPETLEQSGFEAPVLVIIGKVAGLAGTLDWQGLVYEGEEAEGMRKEHG